MHLTNNNCTAHRRHKGHRRDHFLGVPCAEKITRLWRKTAAPQAGKFWDRAEMRSTAEKEAHARASVRPHASSGETDSVRAADGLHAARPRSVRCWRYSARGLLALALYVRCPERVQELRTATAAQATFVIAFGFCFFYGRAPRAEEARVLYWNWPARLLLGWVPVGTCPAPQGQLVAPQAEIFRGGGGGGQFGGQRGGLGQNMAVLLPVCYSEISSRGAFWYMGSGVNSAI